MFPFGVDNGFFIGSTPLAARFVDCCWSTGILSNPNRFFYYPCFLLAAYGEIIYYVGEEELP